MVSENDESLDKLIWVASASFAMSCFLFVLNCVCGCRRKIPKNELLGLAGMVKITNPDENVNFNSNSTPAELNCIAVSSDGSKGESPETSKRGSFTLTATRSLPDLPVDTAVETGEKPWGPQENNTDTNSDLYATLEDSNKNKKKPLTRGPTGDSSYTASQTDDSLSPYARLKGEHPYDQLQSEHQYAQVGGAGGANSSTIQSISHDTPTVSSSSTSSRRFEGDRENVSKSPSLSDPIDDIPAASAIAGSVPANHDLPYMTPPIPIEHFSGDSQDSSKGYTSISVREPLARIMASSRRTDPHYATVSDDSDEMYAAIEERNTGEYTSGSETYAQIAPIQQVVTVQQHARQESSSSACSSVVTPGSPKKEKRQANSPLPEPPQSPTLDEMYAKVVKKGRNNSGPNSPEPSGSPQEAQPPILEVGSGYESLSGPPPSDSDPNYEELQPSRGIVTEPDYASLSRKCDPNYESVSSKESSDPNYETVSQSEPPYERLESDKGYESVTRANDQIQPTSDLYAQINKSPGKM